MNASAKQKNKSVRQIASEILLKVDTRKAYADILLDHALETATLDDRDQALLTEIVYGALRWRGSIDAKLSPHMRRPLTQADPFIRNLLRTTLYQLIFLDKIPDYAAVNEAVELAKFQGGRAAGFVNGVLRNFLRHNNNVVEAAPNAQSRETLAEEFSHPEWLVQRWLADFGMEEAISLMRANNERSPLIVRVNTLKCSREELLDRFLAAGINANPTQWLATRNCGCIRSGGCRTTRLCGGIFSSPRRILAVGDLSSRPAIGRANSRRLCRARWQKHPHRRDDARSGGIDRPRFGRPRYRSGKREPCALAAKLCSRRSSRCER